MPGPAPRLAGGEAGGAAGGGRPRAQGCTCRSQAGSNGRPPSRIWVKQEKALKRLIARWEVVRTPRPKKNRQWTKKVYAQIGVRGDVQKTTVLDKINSSK